MLRDLKDLFSDAQLLPLKMSSASALLWAWSLLYLSNLNNGAFPIFAPELFFPMRLGFTLSSMLGIVLISTTKRNLHPLAAILLVTCGLALSHAAMVTLSVFAIVGSCFAGLGSVSLIQYIDALRTSSLFTSEKRLVGKSIPVAIGIYLLLVSLPQIAALVCLYLFPLLTYLCFPRKGRLIHSFTAKQSIERPKRSALAFFFLFSVAIGILFSLDVLNYGTVQITEEFRVAAVVCALLAFASAWPLDHYYERFSAINPTFSMVLIILSSLLLLGPYLFLKSLDSMAVVIVACLLLSFGILFFKNRRRDIAVTIKRMYGQKTQLFHILEARGRIAGNSVGLILGFLLFGVLFSMPRAAAVNIIILGSLSVTILGLLYEVFTAPVSTSEPTAVDAKTERDESCTAIAERYGLTPREADTLRILADGYSLPYIQEKLFISRGTATTHALHIYQKLGIHRRDELLMFLDNFDKNS
jgi:DNA-binding CsgD family transcriptional regulator